MNSNGNKRYEINVISAFSDGKSGYSDSIPLNAFTEFITGPHDDKTETLISVDKAYRSVPWLHRGINLRADAVSHMPYHIETAGGADVSESAEYKYLIDKLPRLLALTEKSLVKRGCAYWLIETNRAGKKATPRYIPARSVKPLTDPERGLIGFEISWSTGAKQYPLEQVVYFVLENDDSEILPDVPPAQVALEAAGLLYASNAVPARFYTGGMVPVSLVTVPLNTQKADVDKIENFFKRMATGLKKMFSVLGVYEGVDVKIVGHTLKDSITPDITASARDDVAVALGIPPTVLDSTSANYATASSEMIGFYVNTVFPECSLIESTANEQFFTPYGLTFVFDIELHEIMQTIQLAQADGVVTLTGKAPLTVDEGREMLGYEPIGENELEAPEPETPAEESTDTTSEEAEMPMKSRSSSSDFVALLNSINDARQELKAALAAPVPQPVSLSFDVKSPGVTIEQASQPPAPVTVINQVPQVPPTPLEYHAGDVIVQPATLEYRGGDVIVQPATAVNEITVQPAPVTVQNAGDVIVNPAQVNVTNEVQPTPYSIVNEVQPTAVNITNEVQPTPVTVENVMTPAQVNVMNEVQPPMVVIEQNKHINVGFKRNDQGKITSANADVT